MPLHHLISLLFFALLAACGGGQTSTPSAAPSTEEALAVTARIGADCGTVAATSSRGVTYTLVIPLGALTEAVDIRLTPMVNTRVAALARGFVGAVQMEPSGLQFLRAATLRIGAVAPLRSGESLVGFGSANDGTGLALKMAQVVDGQTEMAVSHFSTSGSATATAEELAQVPQASAAGSSSTLAFREEVMDKILRMPWSESTAQALGVESASLFNTWYLLDVEPRLLAALAAPPTDVSDVAYLLAVDAYAMWSASWRRIDALTGGLAGLGGLLSVLDADARVLVARALVAQTDFAVSQCISQSSVRLLQYAAARQIEAAQLGLATDAFGLSSASFAAKVGTCLHPVLDPIVLPTALNLGQARSLDARAQVVFEGKPDPVGAPFIFTVEAVAATLAHPSGRSDAAGRYTTVFTPTADPVEFNVRACLVFDLLSIDTASEFCVSQRAAAPPRPSAVKLISLDGGFGGGAHAGQVTGISDSCPAFVAPFTSFRRFSAASLADADQHNCSAAVPQAQASRSGAASYLITTQQDGVTQLTLSTTGTAASSLTPGEDGGAEAQGGGNLAVDLLVQSPVRVTFAFEANASGDGATAQVKVSTPLNCSGSGCALLLQACSNTATSGSTRCFPSLANQVNELPSSMVLQPGTYRFSANAMIGVFTNISRRDARSGSATASLTVGFAPAD